MGIEERVSRADYVRLRIERDGYKLERDRLLAYVAAGGFDAAVVRGLVDAVNGLRAALRGDDGEYIGGRRRRAVIADADDAAVAALSAVPQCVVGPSPGGFGGRG